MKPCPSGQSVLVLAIIAILAHTAPAQTEEIGVPVDIVVGTSMGSIVGDVSTGY